MSRQSRCSPMPPTPILFVGWRRDSELRQHRCRAVLPVRQVVAVRSLLAIAAIIVGVVLRNIFCCLRCRSVRLLSPPSVASWRVISRPLPSNTTSRGRVFGADASALREFAPHSRCWQAACRPALPVSPAPTLRNICPARAPVQSFLAYCFKVVGAVQPDKAPPCLHRRHSCRSASMKNICHRFRLAAKPRNQPRIVRNRLSAGGAPSRINASLLHCLNERHGNLVQVCPCNLHIRKI